MSGVESGHEKWPVTGRLSAAINACLLAFKYLVKWVLLIWGGPALLLLLAFVLSLWLGHGYGTAKTIQNIKQVGYALFNFENDYECYPDDDTAKRLLKDNDGAFLSKSGGSNHYFSQLFAGGYIDKEQSFRVEGVNEFPDDDITSPSELLKAGEVGFAYVLWGPSMNSSNLPPDAPLVLAYLEKGKKKLERRSIFKRTAHRMVVLRQDMSVVEFKAKDDGTVLMRNGKDYFDWSQPHWGGQKPKIVWPE